MAGTVDDKGIVLTAIDAASISAYSYSMDLKEYQAHAFAPRKGTHPTEMKKHGD